jgi:LacI family transcriptional regulator
MSQARQVRRRRSRLRADGTVTIKDVAAAARVSTATVSRVLAGLPGTGPRVRQRVLDTVKKLNYHPNRLARDLRAGMRKMIGVIIPDLQNPFLTGVVRGVESVLQQRGYSLILGNSDEQAEREQRHLAELRSEGAAGLILAPSDAPDANYGALQGWDIPIVAVDRMPRGLKVDLVCSANREGAREATSHLLGHGYDDIAIINGPVGVDVVEDRLAGFRDALAAAGLKLRQSFVIHSDFRQTGGRTAMQQLLDLPKRPQAVFVANNLMTLGALQAIHERGMDIPNDIALVGFDDMPWSTSLRPPLTAVAQPVEEIGRVAAELLLERLATPGQPARRIVLPTRLIVRASCGTHASAPALMEIKPDNQP